MYLRLSCQLYSVATARLPLARAARPPARPSAPADLCMLLCIYVLGARFHGPPSKGGGSPGVGSYSEWNMHAKHAYACICGHLHEYMHLHIHIYICLHRICMQAYMRLACLLLHMQASWHVIYASLMASMHICKPHGMYIPQGGGGALPSQPLPLGGGGNHWAP